MNIHFPKTGKSDLRELKEELTSVSIGERTLRFESNTRVLAITMENMDKEKRLFQDVKQLGLTVCPLVGCVNWKDFSEHSLNV